MTCHTWFEKLHSEVPDTLCWRISQNIDRQVREEFFWRINLVLSGLNFNLFVNMKF